MSNGEARENWRWWGQGVMRSGRWWGQGGDGVREVWLCWVDWLPLFYTHLYNYLVPGGNIHTGYWTLSITNFVNLCVFVGGNEAECHIISSLYNHFQCSVSCGQGTQQRDVECNRPDQRCTHESRPDSERPCSLDCSYDSYVSSAEGSSFYASSDFSYPDSTGINTFGGWENQRLKSKKKTPQRMSGVPAAGPTNLDPYGPGGAGQRSRVPYPVINALRDSDLYAFKEWKLGPWSEVSYLLFRKRKSLLMHKLLFGRHILTT